MRHGRLGTIDWADRLAILTLDACHVQTDGPLCRLRRHPRDLHESVAGRQEQLTDAGRSDSALRGLNNHATTFSGPTRQFDTRDSKHLSVDEAHAGYIALIDRGDSCRKDAVDVSNVIVQSSIVTG